MISFGEKKKKVHLISSKKTAYFSAFTVKLQFQMFRHTVYFVQCGFSLILWLVLDAFTFEYIGFGCYLAKISVAMS